MRKSPSLASVQNLQGIGQPPYWVYSLALWHIVILAGSICGKNFGLQSLVFLVASAVVIKEAVYRSTDPLAGMLEPSASSIQKSRDFLQVFPRVSYMSKVACMGQ